MVPYNLFLHASLVSEKWTSKDDLPLAKRDTLISIVLGGVVSMAIMISAAAIPGGQINGVLDLAKGLEPLYGYAAKYAVGIGLMAAGVTSAITAPLAAAYVAKSCFGWQGGLKDFKFRIVWMVILILGVLFMSLGIRPIEIIKLAQIANGVLLPVIAAFLVWAVAQSTIMGPYKNTIVNTIFGILIILVVTILGVKSIATVFKF